MKTLSLALLALALALPASLARAQSLHRYDSPPLPALAQWCDDTTAFLANEKMRAMRFVAQEDYAQAEQILNHALTEAARSLSVSPGMRAPITLGLVQRGSRIAAALAPLATAGTLGEISIVSFLSDWVQFVIDTESSIDVPYYLPYHYRYRRCEAGCEGFDLAQFQRLYVQLAQNQLGFVVDHMTRVTERGVFPYGDPRFFLKAAEILAYEVSVDLSRNLDAYAHACSIRALQRLSERLARYNQGDASIYPGGLPWAVAAVREELIEASDALTADACGR